MKVSTAGIRLIACGALVAFGLTVGSGTAHAALVQPTADQCKSYAQEAIDEGEDETLAQELVEHDLDPNGCPAGPAPVPTADCQETIDYDGDYDCTPAPVPTPVPDCHDTIDYDGDYDCTEKPTVAAVTDDSSSKPAVSSTPVAAVQGVTVSNAVPVAAAAVTPAKAATAPVLAAAATPVATVTVKTLPRTGGDVSGIVLLALASFGIGGALLRVDKRRRRAA